MRRLRLVACALLLAGCDDGGGAAPVVDAAGFQGDFEPVGRPLVDAGFEADAAPVPDGPLRLAFEPVEHDADVVLRATDLAFLPAEPGARAEFLLVDKDGYVCWMRQTATGAEQLGQFKVDDTWFDSDAGLISVALDPGFAQNGFFYLGLSTSMETNVIRRYTFDRADFAATLGTAVEVIAVTGARAPRSWHNVGSIGFTETGAMWALFGDKVLNEPALDPNSPLGALLLFEPGRGPEGGWTGLPDNPYADGSGHPAVYSKGFRSPWKGAYHEGRWFIGDIGLDTFEELNVVDTPAQSHGWPAVEGACRAEGGCPGHSDPWIYYGRGVTGFVRDDRQATSAGLRSIWVSPVYRQNGVSDPYRGRLDGTLLFGDFYVGYVRAAAVNDPAGASTHVGHVVMPTAFAQAPDGHLYATAMGQWPTDAPEAKSRLYRVVLAED
ncbi:MAG: PQQ-dependent sugar dehydrogenase [Myxococcales bacterium]|nr:PQQ-dependent sugar dehydrogenase [Myxococcales bacterium]